MAYKNRRQKKQKILEPLLIRRQLRVFLKIKPIMGIFMNNFHCLNFCFA